MIDIDKLEELAKAATPGDWFPETYSNGHRQVCGNQREIDEDNDEYAIVADVFKREDHEYLVAANPAAILSLIAEVRALREDAVPTGARVESYSLPDAEIEIFRVKQLSGPDKWKASHGGFYCLNKLGQWELEPMPSSRDDDFIDRCRFDTEQEAIDAARKEKA